MSRIFSSASHFASTHPKGNQQVLQNLNEFSSMSVVIISFVSILWNFCKIGNKKGFNFI